MNNLFYAIPCLIIWLLLTWFILYVITVVSLELYHKHNPVIKYWYNAFTKEIGIERENGVIEKIGEMENHTPKTDMPTIETA